MRLKHFLFISTLCLVGLTVKSQQIPALYGTHVKQTGNIFSSIGVSSLAFNEISVLNTSFKGSNGQTTFDETNSRYFVKSGSTILVIDAFTGNIVDSMSNVGNFYNIEYDKISNSLVGIADIGSSLIFRQINLNTKITTAKGIITLVDSLVVGESTFDQQNRRYFTHTNIGVIVIDSNGVFQYVLCSSPFLRGIEYDANTNRVYYLDLNGSYYNFVSVEATTCVVGLLSTMNGHSAVPVGESTFDQLLGHYYNRTNLGLLQLSVVTGDSLQTFVVPNDFKGNEFTRNTATNIFSQKKENNILVFPNPSENKINFLNLVVGAKLEIYNLEGRTILESYVTDSSVEINLEGEQRGVYFYRITSSSSESLHGKILLK